MLRQVDRSLFGGVVAGGDDRTGVIVAEVTVQSLLTELISGVVLDEQRHELLHRRVFEARCSLVDRSSHLLLVDELSVGVDEISFEARLDVVDTLVV